MRCGLIGYEHNVTKKLTLAKKNLYSLFQNNATLIHRLRETISIKVKNRLQVSRRAAFSLTCIGARKVIFKYIYDF